MLGGEFPVVVVDLSFISILVTMALAGVASDSANLVVLIKPQFEVGRADWVMGGSFAIP